MKTPQGWQERRINGTLFGFVREVDGYRLRINIVGPVSYHVDYGTRLVAGGGIGLTVADAARRAMAAVRRDQAAC